MESKKSNSVRNPAFLLETKIEDQNKHEAELRREEGTDWGSFLSKNPEVKKMMLDLLQKSDK
jgi:hypothetical protein